MRWGWKILECPIIPSVSLNEAGKILIDEGFSIQERTNEHLLMRRSASLLTIKGEKAPLSLAIFKTETGLILALGYEYIVLFGTGDLARLADLLSGKFRAIQTYIIAVTIWSPSNIRKGNTIRTYAFENG